MYEESKGYNLIRTGKAMLLKIIASESHDPLKTPNKSLCCFQRRLAEWNSLLAGITSTQSGDAIENDLTLVFWGWEGAVGEGGG